MSTLLHQNECQMHKTLISSTSHDELESVANESHTTVPFLKYCAKAKDMAAVATTTAVACPLKATGCSRAPGKGAVGSCGLAFDDVHAVAHNSENQTTLPATARMSKA